MIKPIIIPLFSSYAILFICKALSLVFIFYALYYLFKNRRELFNLHKKKEGCIGIIGLILLIIIIVVIGATIITFIGGI